MGKNSPFSFPFSFSFFFFAKSEKSVMTIKGFFVGAQKKKKEMGNGREKGEKKENRGKGEGKGRKKRSNKES
jgi:hypothetical protein